MTVGRVQITAFIERETKGVDAPVGHVFHPASIGAKTKCVPRYHLNRISVRTGYGRLIGESVASMNPPIVPAEEVVDHTMCIAMLERSDNRLYALRLAIEIGVSKPIDRRNTIGNSSVKQWKNANWDIQCIAEVREYICRAIAIRILENRYPVLSLTGTSGKGILERLCYPHPPFRVEGQVDRLTDIRFRSVKLNFESLRQHEACALFFGSARRG